MPDPSLGAGVSNPGSADSSFNADRLESLHSAENIRISMQKYLQDKREHLKKASQQMVERRRQSELPAMSSAPSQRPGLRSVNPNMLDSLNSRLSPKVLEGPRFSWFDGKSPVCKGPVRTP